MPDLSVSAIGKDAAGKLQAAAMKTNKKQWPTWHWLFDNMKLSRLGTKASSEEWLEGEAWKVMQSLIKKYHPNKEA